MQCYKSGVATECGRRLGSRPQKVD